MAEPKGIKWSAPVLIRKEAKGLAVTVPPQVIDALELGAGDVLNFTQLPDGAIEVWRVKKSTYTSLDDMKPAASEASAKKAAKGKGAKR
jgi:antitoxin component of MazEF toxin-antitoxin module